jgi:hypothetical protein
MPNLFRTLQGEVRKPSVPLSFELADGQALQAIWAGSATEEKLEWWLNKAGNDLAQSEPVAAIASKADDDGEMIWADAPPGARLIFVVLGEEAGKGYRLAKMVTTAATPAQHAYFRHDRAALFGSLGPEGGIRRIAPLAPPPPQRPVQGELF